MRTLNELKLWDTAVVKEIFADGQLKRRFFDIGIVNGTKIKCVAISPQGDPKAFFVRGAVIALRNADSVLIEVDENE